jgi:hypothetical protein
MSLLEGYISNFTYAGCYFLYVEFSDFYVNQSLAGQTIAVFRIFVFRVLRLIPRNSKTHIILQIKFVRKGKFPIVFCPLFSPRCDLNELRSSDKSMSSMAV